MVLLPLPSTNFVVQTTSAMSPSFSRTAKWPTQSAGPHFPRLPLNQPLLRIIMGDVYADQPPIQWFIEPPTSTSFEIEARMLHHKASITIPSSQHNSIPDYWFDFTIPSKNFPALTFVVKPTASSTSDLYHAVFLQQSFSSQNGKGFAFAPVLNSSHQPVASLTIRFIHVTPCPIVPPTAIKVPFIPRFTGHRGMGSSGLHVPHRPLENSLESFCMSALQRPDVTTIELDVQPTLDGKPVIMHDPRIYPSQVKSKRNYDSSDHTIDLLSLTHQQADEIYRNSYDVQNHKVSPDHNLFRKWAIDKYKMPTDVFDVKVTGLKETCDMLPPGIDMLIELKYPFPQQRAYDIIYPNMDRFVDDVLKELMAAKRVPGQQDRRIAFLSFNADICMSLLLKQNNYPVYLSHCAGLDPPCDMRDPRVVSLRQGFNFAKSQGLDGMMILNELVNVEPDIVSDIMGAGLPILTYGKRNCEAEFVKKQFRMGINGVIADDVLLLKDDLDKCNALS